MSDYIARTIEAYDSAPEKFAGATGDMINLPEIKIMLGLLPDTVLPVLDVGCGTGRDCQALTDLGHAAIGIDLSDKLLEKAHELYPKLDFRKMDMRKLELPDTSFSAVWCNAALLHLNDVDMQIALSEIRRILVTDGVLAVSLKVGKGSGEVVESFSTDLARFYNFKSLDELNELLQSAGFKVQGSHVLNERERFGPDKRDLNWAWSFGTKI